MSVQLAKRIVYMREQPEVLIDNLQRAIRINHLGEELPHHIQLTQLLFKMGVPHGVHSAIVWAHDVRIQWEEEQPLLFFCQSHNYRTLRSTLTGEDRQRYPHPARSFISVGTPIPFDGLFGARLRVSVNGSVSIHVEQFYKPSHMPL